MPKTRRQYPGAAVSTTITSGIDSDDTTISVAAATGWPSGSTPFYVVVSPQLSAEEKMLVTRNGTTLTVVTAGRGVDGTSASSHSGGSAIYPVIAALDLDEANEMTSVLTTKGDLLVHGASTFERLGAGTNNLPLVADSAQASGLKYAQLTSAGLGSSAVTEAKINDGAVTTAKLGDAAVTAAKIASAVAGDGLAGGAGTALSVNVDDSSIAISSDQVVVKDLGVSEGKLAANAVTATKIANGAVVLAKLGSDVPRFTVSTDDPTGGADGDVWVKVTA